MFENININSDLQKAITDKGFTSLTEVQTLVMAQKNEGKDLLVSSQTGSGKTLAYGLSIANSILKNRGDKFKLSTLIVAPTRELALQVFHELSWLFSKTPVKIATAIGGMDTKKEKKKISDGIDLLIGTPGRINDHLKKHYLSFDNLTSLVLDEADEMLDLGFKEDLDKITDETPDDTRVLMFSATLPKKILSLANRYQKEALRIDASDKQKPHADITYETYFLKKHDVENAIFNLLRFHDDKNVIIFCSTRASVTHIYSRILNRGFTAVSLSGALNQSERFKSLQSMKNGRCKICVATDVAARGIDLPNIDIVIHADLPRNSEGLLHRSGRTGRAKKKGTSILFCSPKEIWHYENIVGSAMVKPSLKEFLSREEIEIKDNEKVTDSIKYISKKSDGQNKFAKSLLEEFTPLDIALAYIQNIKSKLSPIEEVESLDLKLFDKKNNPAGKKRNKSSRRRRERDTKRKR